MESSPVLVPLEEEFGNLLLKPRALDLLLVVSKLGEIPLFSLLGHILKLEAKFGCCCEGIPFFWNKIYLPL